MEVSEIDEPFFCFCFSGSHSVPLFVVCCNFGSGGPVELFEGSTEEGVLLFSDPLEENGRFTQSFSLIGDGKVPSAASNYAVWPSRQHLSIGLIFSLIVFSGI